MPDDVFMAYFNHLNEGGSELGETYSTLLDLEYTYGWSIDDDYCMADQVDTEMYASER